MTASMPEAPRGSGRHPVLMTVISANRLAESGEFYTKLFNWQLARVSTEITAGVTPAGPTVSLRSNVSANFQGMVPFIGVPDVDAALEGVVAAGGAVQRAPWDAPMLGKLARFTAPSGSIYGLMTVIGSGEVPRIVAPFGANPKPPEGTVCALEMYASDGATASKFFGEVFGWGTLATMPQYVAFDPGAGVNGTFQMHTPAAPAVAYVYAADVRAKLDALESLGGKRMGDAMQMPGMATFGYFTDPSGTTMGMIGP